MPIRLRILVLLATFIFVSGCNWWDDESSNSNLLNLSVAGVQLTPSFDSAITEYTATVDAATLQAMVSAVPQDGKASITIGGSTQPSAQSGAVITLAVGANEVTVTVTSEDGGDQRIYTIVIMRPAPTYSIGGTVSGLTGMLVLLNNGGDDLSLSGDGTFAFPTPVDDGSDFDVTVGTQPDGLVCSVDGGSGSVAGGDVTSISVSCVVPVHAVGGTVSGLNGTLVLQNNGGDDLSLAENGSFTFTTPIEEGAAYNVTVGTQPGGQVCSIENGAGTMGAADITDVSVTCIVPTYSVGGTIGGLSGSVTLQNNGGDDLALTENGSFLFSASLASGAAYDVTVSAQPAVQLCAVTNGTGTVGMANVTSVSVECIAQTYSVGGTISGLSGSVTLQNNGEDDLAVTENGSFVFAASLLSGATYNVSVSAQPAGQLCTVSNGSGTIGTADVISVSVACVAQTYSVGGSVSGLSGSVTLQNNGGDDLTVTGNGTFTFATSVANGAGYSVTVSAQPAGQSCSVTNGVGTVAAADVTNIDVSCVDTGGGVTSGWTWANPLPQGNNIEDIIWAGSQFVAVGAYGTIRTSPDGINWTTQDSGTNEFLFGVAWNGSKLIAVGANATILSSSDGITWSSIDVGLITRLNKVIWSGSQFVAVGGYVNSQVLTSPDGVTWTPRNVATSYVSLVDVAWNGSVFAAVASGSGIYNYVYTSPNGITWTRRYLGPSNTGYSITTDDNQFVVAAGRYVYTSIDGITWSLVVDENVNPYAVYASLWDGNQFVLAASNALLTSPDGVTWTTSAGLSFGSVLTFATNGSQYLIAGRAGNLTNSPDLAAWTQQTTGPVNNLLDMVWTGDLFVAVGHTIIMTSPDGVAWTQRDQNPGATWPNSDSLSAVAASDSVFVAVGSGGALLTSPDGLTWGPGNPGVTASLNDVIWDGTQFVATGSSNTILTSTDGVTWSLQTSSSTDDATQLHVLGWSGAQFVAAGWGTGYNMIIMTSPDAITWTTQSISAPQYATAEDIIWDGSQWLMVTSRGLYTSPDGIVWTAQTIAGTEYEVFNSIAYNGIHYFLSATSSLFLTSTDGLTWSSSNSITGGIERMVWDGSKLVTVGYQGSILNYSDR
jgi:hypothetical protein